MALAGTMAEVPTRGFERVDDLLCEAVFCTSGRQQHLDNLDWLSDGRDGLRVEMGEDPPSRIPRRKRRREARRLRKRRGVICADDSSCAAVSARD